MEHNELVCTAVVEPFVKLPASQIGYRCNPIALLGTTAPEMMLFPHIREPDTGSRMPSISTGGAATNAVINIAAKRVGIIRMPNQPTRPLFVLVTSKVAQLELEPAIEVIDINKDVLVCGYTRPPTYPY